jgi:hypothetical protein
MRKLCSYLVVALILSIGTPAFAQDRAVEISIAGIGPPVDIAGFQTVRQVIGHAVSNGVIDKFIVLGYGIEGGFTACAKAAPFTETQELKAFVRQLRSIAPNPATTSYSVTLTSRCAGRVTMSLPAQHYPILART